MHTYLKSRELGFGKHPSIVEEKNRNLQTGSANAAIFAGLQISIFSPTMCFQHL
jgi:ribosome recycling factor